MLILTSTDGPKGISSTQKSLHISSMNVYRTYLQKLVLLVAFDAIPIRHHPISSPVETDRICESSAPPSAEWQRLLWPTDAWARNASRASKSPPTHSRAIWNDPNIFGTFNSSNRGILLGEKWLTSTIPARKTHVLWPPEVFDFPLGKS